MEKEVISQKQAIIIMSTFIIGSSAILGAGSQAKQDVWLAMIVAMAMASLIIFVYARISKLFPGKSLYEILNFLFGKLLGKIMAMIFIWYSFHLGALILRAFTEFVRTVSLPNTPDCIFAFSAIILNILTIRGGIELLGRFLGIFFPVYLITIILVTTLSIPIFDYNNLKPVLYDGIKPVINASFGIFSFPFAETVVLMCLMGDTRKNTSPYKVYYTSLFLGGIILLIIAIRSVLVLGIPNKMIQNFASYSSTRLIRVGSFLQRIEATIAIVFMVSGFTKCTVCMHTATKGLAYLFDIKNYRKLGAPVGILIALSSMILFKDSAELFEWTANIYPYYVIPFQIIIPLIVWITAEIKTRTSGKKNTTEAKSEAPDDVALPESNN